MYIHSMENVQIHVPNICFIFLKHIVIGFKLTAIYFIAYRIQSPVQWHILYKNNPPFGLYPQSLEQKQQLNVTFSNICFNIIFLSTSNYCVVR